MYYHRYRPFDQVSYSGEKYRSELRGKLGIISGRVDRSETSYVVDFGEDVYVLHESLMSPFQAINREEKTKAEQEIYLRRRPKKDEEE